MAKADSARARLDLAAVAAASPAPVARTEPRPGSVRVATIDWMRGLVMLLMVVDHASMAFDAGHLSEDSAMYPEAVTMALPGAEFFTRWMTHICAPTFVFLAGAALALSVERRVAKGADAWGIDRGILVRGAIIALLDPTIVSLGSGRLTLQVLLAIGLAMMAMAFLRRLPDWTLLALGAGWFALGEVVTGWVWHPPGPSSIAAALTIATYGAPDLVIKYPIVPWLAMMAPGWVFGRHLIRFGLGRTTRSPVRILLAAGAAALVVFVAARYANGYGNMFLPRMGDSWQQWLHVSKYPPSLTYASLELGLLFLTLAVLMRFEDAIGFRRNGILLVFGQTAMFFYLAHRLAFEIPATYFGLRGAGDLTTTYLVALLAIVALYPACLWYRGFKAAHPTSFLKYL